MRVLLYIKDESLKKKDLEGFLYGTGNGMEKYKSGDRRMCSREENSAFGSKRNRVASNISLV